MHGGGRSASTGFGQRDEDRRTSLLVLTPSHSAHGGAEQILETLRQGLPRHGFQVEFGLARGTTFNTPSRYRASFPGMEAIEIDGRSGTREGRIASLRKTLRGRRPDIVLSCRLFDALEAVRQIKLHGQEVRLGVTLFANEPDYVYDLIHYEDTVDVCVADSTLAARVVRRATALPEDRVVSIPGGVHRPRVARTEVGPDRALRLAYVGRLEQVQKRVLDLSATLEGLQGRGVPFTCRVVGAGSAEAPLRQSIAVAGLQDRVSFEGWLPREALYEDVYPQLDVLLHFAEWEGNPIAPREAMAHGVVPVMSRFRGCRAEGAFEDGSTVLLFDVGDTDEAARQVARLHADRAHLRRLSEGTRASLTESSFVGGAVAAWAHTLTRVCAMPLRKPRDARPRLPASGALASLGIPPRMAARLRKLLGRQPVPREPGDEWPHWSGLASREELDAIQQWASALDS